MGAFVFISHSSQDHKVAVRGGGAVRGIQDGQVKGDAVVFYTQGVTTTGNGEQPYKEHYRGTLKGGAIEFIRQNDVASGGLPQTFTTTRE